MVEQARTLPVSIASPCARAGVCATGAASDPDTARHPCYSEQAHHHYARMHVAVAPACNIQCHYCNRKFDCANESRPGVVSRRVTPEQAIEQVLQAAARLPQLSVVGIAGPGDALAQPEKTFTTLRDLRAALPDLVPCLSTNGLALPDHVATLAELGVRHLTITINAVDPEVGARIHPWIFHEHRRLTGTAAARVLQERQLAGLRAAVAAGMKVKVNSVLIPGVNDAHLPEVHRAVRRAGAFLHNIVPLISDPAHGTHYGLNGQREPTPAELATVQAACGSDLRLMRHCRQCRADAVGMLGQDCAGTDGAAAADGDAVRERYRQFVARERRDRERAVAAAQAEPGVRSAPPCTLAVATRAGGRVNEHFGHAREFHVYRVEGGVPTLLGVRRAPGYCQGGDGDDDALERILALLADCDGVLVAKIGHCPRERLAAAGLPADTTQAHELIEVALLRHAAARAAAVTAAA